MNCSPSPRSTGRGEPSCGARAAGEEPGTAAMVGLSARLIGGPPNGAERRHVLTHRPNSGTCSTPRETASQPFPEAAGPPSAWSCCDGSPGTIRRVRRDWPSGRPGSARWSSAATQQTAPSRSSRLVFQKPALVGLNPVVIPPKPLPSSGRWRRCSAPAGISSAACATGRPGRSEQFPATATAEMQCYRKSATRRRCLS